MSYVFCSQHSLRRTPLGLVLKAVAPCLTFTCNDSFPTLAGLAQSVERLTAERELPGSIPGSGPTLRVLK